MDIPPFNFTSFKAAGEQFITTLTAKLIEKGIRADSLICDHLCFRVGSHKEYDFYKAALSHHGKLLAEAMVNGRSISTFQLTTAFRTNSHEISLLELPAPKQETFYPTGFEHAEFLLDESFQTFRSKFPDLNFVEGGNKIFNPELCLKLGQGMQAKFHHLSLDRVIALEQAK